MALAKYSCCCLLCNGACSYVYMIGVHGVPEIISGWMAQMFDSTKF